eukprot:CAMPEP_0179410492 /NCGR_PEP_ID=MMETSP0799-20121207/3320_1 /TAXON_ID=46947 /ORGANISM="Geminigera cryophila, Strain CCMP2564" /LENGTH=254 /DNA_ID=CAMNT_0021182353 /DNA_START=108 /DNA_END=872 /DNA_ORIENTATION=-
MCKHSADNVRVCQEYIGRRYDGKPKRGRPPGTASRKWLKKGKLLHTATNDCDAKSYLKMLQHPVRTRPGANNVRRTIYQCVGHMECNYKLMKFKTGEGAFEFYEVEGTEHTGPLVDRGVNESCGQKRRKLDACAGKVELYGMKDSLLSKNVIDGSHMVLQAEYRIMSLDSMGGHGGVKDTLGAPKAHHASDVPHDIAPEAPPLSMHDAVDGVVHHSHSPHLDASSDPGAYEDSTSRGCESVQKEGDGIEKQVEL